MGDTTFDGFGAGGDGGKETSRADKFDAAAEIATQLQEVFLHNFDK